MSTQAISTAAASATAGAGFRRRRRDHADAVPELGFNQIAVKLALPDIPPMLQAMIRSAGALPVMLHRRLAARRQFLPARRHAVARPLRRAPVRHRVRADLQRTAAHLGIARGRVPLHRAVLRRAWLLSVPGRAPAPFCNGAGWR